MFNKNNIILTSPVLILLLCSLFLFLNNHVTAQFYQSGEDPASIKWKQINTPNFQIIFPPEFEKEANRLANTLEYLYVHVSQSLQHKPRKISVLLHSQSAYSNGMVTWAPKRMELYTTPSQDNYAQDWLDQLAVHELRHVVQIDKLNQGITQIASLIFGQQAVGVVVGLLPRWFLEGDAINNETALTSTGRGRTASFEMEMKTLVTSQNSLYSYEKALRGSYRNYIPDPYQLGYPMVAWTRKNFGPPVYANDLNFVGQNPFTIFPFPLSLKKQIGLPSRKLYQATYNDLRKHWDSQISKVDKNDNHLILNKLKKKNYTNYQLPQFINDSTILAVKSGIDQLTTFVLIHENKGEEKIHTPGNYNNDQLSYANGSFVWGEEIPDIRWPNRSFNCIKIWDLNTHEERLLTKRTRYFAPALSHDGTKIVAVEVTLSNEIYLVVLDSKTGILLDRISSPENNLLQLPKFNAQGNDIVMISTGKKGKSLKILNLPSKTWKTLIPNTFRNINAPTYAGANIIFTADYNGTDNLYAYDQRDASIWQITNARYGIKNANASANNKILYFAQYSSQGFDIMSAPLDYKDWKNLSEVVDDSPRLYEASAKQENFNFQDSIIPIKDYPVRSYSKLTHLINVHSWAPFYYDYNNINTYNTAATPGFSILSQDKLGTCISSAGYSYDQGQSFFKAGVTYKALYPVIDFSYSYGGREVVNRPTSTSPLPLVPSNGINVMTQIYVPFNFTKGCYITGLTPEVDWQFRNEWFYNNVIKNYTQGMSYLSYSLYAYSYLKLSLRDLAPQWGASFIGRYSNTPFENTTLSSIWSAQGRLYLPGILKHHSLKLSLGYQEQVPQNYFYPLNFLVFPRGYVTESTYKLTAFTSDYSFPIAYPDLAIGPIIYIKRIRGNLFYDMAANSYKYRESQNKISWKTDNLSSLGLDLTADFHFLRIIFPVNAGIRMIYIPEHSQYSTQLLLSIDLSNY